MTRTARTTLFALAVSFIVSIPVAPRASAATDPTMFDGRPTFSEGEGFGYYVWREGDAWHVRWTTFGANHRFTGFVRAEGGDLKALERIDVDTERRVIAPGRPPHLAVGPRGRVRAVGGRPARVATREEDRIAFDGDRTIRFVTRTDDDIDGFDFKATGDVRAVRFTLEIDGHPATEQIQVGRGNLRPREDPLVVRLR